MLMGGSLVATPIAQADETPYWGGRYAVTFRTDQKSGTSYRRDANRDALHRVVHVHDGLLVGRMRRVGDRRSDAQGKRFAVDEVQLDGIAVVEILAAAAGTWSVPAQPPRTPTVLTCSTCP